MNEILLVVVMLTMLDQWFAEFLWWISALNVTVRWEMMTVALERYVFVSSFLKKEPRRGRGSG